MKKNRRKEEAKEGPIDQEANIRTMMTKNVITLGIAVIAEHTRKVSVEANHVAIINQNHAQNRTIFPQI